MDLRPIEASAGPDPAACRPMGSLLSRLCLPRMERCTLFLRAGTDFLCADGKNLMPTFRIVFASALLAAGLLPRCPAQPESAKRPMTFEDMMSMKRLGETAVSPDGKWLAYSGPTGNLEQNTKTAELGLQMISGGGAIP